MTKSAYCQVTKHRCLQLRLRPLTATGATKPTRAAAPCTMLHSLFSGVACTSSVLLRDSSSVLHSWSRSRCGAQEAHGVGGRIISVSAGKGVLRGEEGGMGGRGWRGPRAEGQVATDHWSLGGAEPRPSIETLSHTELPAATTRRCAFAKPLVGGTATYPLPHFAFPSVQMRSSPTALHAKGRVCASAHACTAQRPFGVCTTQSPLAFFGSPSAHVQTKSSFRCNMLLAQQYL
jgi:hypothetical protein